MRAISRVTTLFRCYSTVPIPKTGLPLSDCTVEWFKSLISQEVMLQDQQDKLMKFAMPYYEVENAADGFKAINEKIVINGSGDSINGIKVENLKDQDTLETKPLPLVMLHGYGAALGLFFKNFHGLVKDQPGSTVYALDLPGFGLSNRKPELDVMDETLKHLHIQFDSQTVEHYKHIHRSLRMPDVFSLDYNEFENYKRGQKELIELVEGIYVDALKRWLDVKLIDKIDLLGHSFGGYMSIAFALKYPERVNKLVLVSPGGIERSPYAITNKLRKPKEGTLVELKPSGNPADYRFLGRLPVMSPTFMKFWEKDITMFDLLRLSGPVGAQKLTEYIFSKYNRNNQFDSYEELRTMSLYMYHCFSKASFSDRTILKIFSPTVVAKYPMLDRIHELKVKESLWIYGEFDWMFNSCGEEAVKELTGYGKSAKFDVVSRSGHNLYLDNPEEFNQKVKNFLQWK